MPRRSKSGAQDIQDRLAELDYTAVLCRAVGHQMQRVAPGNGRRAELRKLGQAELLMRCANGCGYERGGTYDLHLWTITEEVKRRAAR